MKTKPVLCIKGTISEVKQQLSTITEADFTAMKDRATRKSKGVN